MKLLNNIKNFFGISTEKKYKQTNEKIEKVIKNKKVKLIKFFNCQGNEIDDDKNYYLKRYYNEEGLLHRENNLPAKELKNYNNEIYHCNNYHLTKEYYYNGKLHRTNGPALICVSQSINHSLDSSYYHIKYDIKKHIFVNYYINGNYLDINDFYNTNISYYIKKGEVCSLVNFENDDWNVKRISYYDKNDNNLVFYHEKYRLTGEERFYNDKNKLHNISGPAIIYCNGEKEFWINGEIFLNEYDYYVNVMTYF